MMTYKKGQKHYHTSFAKHYRGLCLFTFPNDPRYNGQLVVCDRHYQNLLRNSQPGDVYKVWFNWRGPSMGHKAVRVVRVARRKTPADGA